jgi:DNA-binding MarR family transcriptional regulator
MAAQTTLRNTLSAISLDDANRLRLVIARLQRRLRQQANAGITPSQLAVLSALARLGPSTPGELAAAEAVKPPSITRIVNVLEESQLVERIVVSDDRRSVRLRLTPKARRLLQSIRDQRTAWLADRFAEMTPAQIGDLQRGIAALEQIVEGGR